MDILDLRNYLLSLPLVEECQPFGDDAVVYKIGGRMFACYILQHTERIAVKCEPERAIDLRDEYIDIITPAYHSINAIGTICDLSYCPDRLSSAKFATPTSLLSAKILPQKPYATRF